MTTYSHAAIEWAATHPTTWAAAGFDAGAASVACVCGTPGLDYDGPDEDCPIHGGPGPVRTVPAEPITVRDPKELDALPLRSAVMDSLGFVWQFLPCYDGDRWCLAVTGDTPERRTAMDMGGWFPMTLLAPASPPVPAPVLLTADDPRWRDGAKVRGEFADGSAVEGILLRREIRWGDPDYYYLYTGNLAAVSLLAEAPDPDAELRHRIVTALNEATTDGYTDAEAAVIIATLRAEGVLS